jgi:hypothetical protein
MTMVADFGMAGAAGQGHGLPCRFRRDPHARLDARAES